MFMLTTPQSVISIATVAFALASCAALTTGGQRVMLTENPADVQGCALLGDVSADPPFGLPSDWKVKLRNAAAARGGNRVLSNGALVGSVPGTAYRCP